ncbi:S41 family peptidase [Cytophaga aurantiaca]|uniref:S41 family peptidase n=1 Tax=Cytophaga aurantiaca TaxID=29530 RepID=UPI001B7FD2DC|nr:S41 family peptidase [Cytophaga aurantiaca]
MSITEYYKLTTALLAKIKDGHTVVDGRNMGLLLNDELLFPYSIYKIKGAYYLNKSGTDDKSLTGYKILKINGEKMDTIVGVIQKYLAHEGENETVINTQLKYFPAYYFLYFDKSESFEIEYEEEPGKIKTIKLKGVEYGTFKKNTLVNQEPLSVEFKNDSTVILKVRSFSNGYIQKDRKAAEEKLDSIFNKMYDLKITNLILDLRGNGGGAPELANYLFSYLSSKPYYYFASIGIKYNSTKNWKYLAEYPRYIPEVDFSKTTTKHGLNLYTQTNEIYNWQFEKQYPKPNSLKGKIYVLINGGSFSSTGHVLSLMRDKGIGIFYGEYSQGSNYSNAGLQAFILPYSQTKVWIPFIQFKMRTPNFQYDPKGIKPDVEIELQPDDLKTNYDRVLNYALMEIETNK